MEIDGTQIEDTYAEAFGMRAARVLITADSARWASIAARAMSGFATSVIACGCEAAPEGVPPPETPDGRPGARVLLFARSTEAVRDQLVKRIGQCVMTSAGSACYDDLPSPERVRVGSVLRFFGDGQQASKRLEAPLCGPEGNGPARRFWRIPVMDGEFLVEDRFGVRKGVAGGNFLILGRTAEAALAGAERAVAAIAAVPGVILPFPGGMVRSGSKVGSRYKTLIASTNTPYCPTLRDQPGSALTDEIGAVLEIVIDGLGLEEVQRAMATGLRAACGDGVIRITAGNYGGKLGKHLIRLHPLLGGA
jgi:formylmethanofuran--tetrahydromethanopterin N-formyltransferase